MNDTIDRSAGARLVCGCASGACAGHGLAPPALPRRRLLALGAGLAASPFIPRTARAQSTLKPDEALKRLMDGNARYVAVNLNSFKEDLDILRAHTVEKQEPFAAVLSCADSRVPVELVFDQSIGHLFVCRLAGNIATPEVIASLEYAGAVLGIRAIVVLGHSKCGAVAATIKGSAVPGQISALYPRIRPAVDLAGSDTEAATKANARIQAALLAEASTVISDLVKTNKMKVVAAYYDVTTGTITLLH